MAVIEIGTTSLNKPSSSYPTSRADRCLGPWSRFSLTGANQWLHYLLIFPSWNGVLLSHPWSGLEWHLHEEAHDWSCRMIRTTYIRWMQPLHGPSSVLVLNPLRTWNRMSSIESESLPSTSRDEHDATDTSQVGIGLSNPHLFQRERIMLDLINRMHNTGLMIIGPSYLTPSLIVLL